MKLTTGLRVAAYALALAGPGARARADFITAHGWIVSGASSQNASLAELATACGGPCTGADANVTFTTSGISFNASSHVGSIQNWLSTSGFALHKLSSDVDLNTTDMSPTLWEFTGNAAFTSPHPFTVEHDDGVTFTVNGQTVANAPLPTVAIQTNGSYTGPAGGSLPFDFIYGECCGGPAVLVTDLVGPQNAPVPEPGPIALLGTALLLVAGAIRRRNLRA